MPLGQSSDPKLEIGHILFIDVVGYSKLLTNEQRDLLQELNRIVRETAQFREAAAASKLIRIPTGDGMVLAFFTSPDAPVRCAVAISRALDGTTYLPLRMGIHSGPVELIEDVSEKTNLAGAGVNIAQRVMACGDAGHILLSARAADDLAQHGEWKAQLHEIGEAEVKHGARVRIFSLYEDRVGNAVIPQTLRRQRLVRRRRVVAASTALAILVIGTALGIWAWHRHMDSLRQAATEAAAQRTKSVAVLPFENLSTEEKNAVFAGSVHREVLSNLAKVADLKVISRTSVTQYKPGTDRNVKQIADELGVNYLVEGSVQREADRVHITVELIDARTGTDAWAETYDGNSSDILSFQSEIAQRISNQLGAKLSPRESTELATRSTQDMAAFESYVRARALMETREIEDADKFVDDYTRAVQLLEQAVVRDPQFAAAYWALTEANIQLFRSSDPPNPEYRARAEAALKEAQRLAPEAGETIYARARVTYYGYHDFKRALAALEEASKLLPNNSDISLTRAFLYRRFDRWQEAYAQFVRASELNPQDITAYISAGGVAVGLRWWAETDQNIERIIKRFPRRAPYARLLGKATTLRLRGDVEAGDKEMESVNLGMETEFVPLFERAMWRRNYIEARRLVNEAAKYPEIDQDRWEKELQLVFVTKEPPLTEAAQEAEKRLEEKLQRSPSGDIDGGLTMTLSTVKMILGKKDEAVHLAERSVEQHPLSEDFFINGMRLKSLAYIYVCAGDRERAIQTFARLVQIPNGIFYGPLKYDPVFDDLRKDPRFGAILKQSQQPFPRL